MREVQHGSTRRSSPHARKSRKSRPPRREPGDFQQPAPGPPKPKRRLVRRVLTHNATILLVALVAVGVAVLNFDPGPGGPPAAKDLSMTQLSDLLNHYQMDPATAADVANAKQIAYQQQLKVQKAQLKAQKLLEEKAKKDAKLRAALAAKAAAAKAAAKAAAALAARATNPAANQALGRQMNALKGWSACWPSLLTMWNHESGWNQHAMNPYGGAYGIPQSLPGSKMASAGPDWQNSSATQIAWGLGYIQARYHDPCGAWSWWQAHSWY
jgi:hypothetical protein